MPFSSFCAFTATDTAGHGNCYDNAVTQGSLNNGARLKDVYMQVRKARQLVHQTELKVEAIEAIIHEIVIFHPKIKIIHRPGPTDEDGSGPFAEDALVSAA